MNMLTGNLLLCAGRSGMSNIIAASGKLAGARGEAAKLTHGAFLFVGDKPQVVETTTLNWNGKKGFQVNDFEEWKHEYEGDLWMREINYALDNAVTALFIQQHRKDPYENGLSGLMALVASGIGGHHESLIKLWDFMGWHTTIPHCTELIALLFNACDRADFDVHHMPPFKLWAGGEFDKGLYTTTFGKPERIKTWKS